MAVHYQKLDLEVVVRPGELEDHAASSGSYGSAPPHHYVQGGSSLHQAVLNKDLQQVKYIMATDAQSCLTKNLPGEIPLHLACRTLHDEDKEIVEELLNCDAEMAKQQLQAEVIVQQQGDGHSSLPSDPEQRGRTYTPLHIVAAGFRNKEIINILIQKCEELEVIIELLKRENDDGDTIVHDAASVGSLSMHIMMKLIMEKYKEVTLELLQQQRNSGKRDTPVHLAVSNGHISMLRLILQQYGTETFIELIEKRNGTEKRPGDTPVHVAAVKGNISMLELMHDKAGDDMLDYRGYLEKLPLHSASGFGKLNAVKKLLEWDENGHTLEAIYQPPGLLVKFTSQQTPLTSSCYFGRDEVVEYLLEQGAVIHQYALIAAIQGLHCKCVKMLLSKDIISDKYLTSSYKSRPDSPFFTNAFHELIRHMPDMAEYALNTKCVKFGVELADSKHYQRHLANSENFEVTLDYGCIDSDGQNCDVNEPDVPFTKKTHPLYLMVQYGRESLLTHPVVAAMIHDKWNSRYGMFSLLHWLLYVIFFMCCANILPLMLPTPNSDFCTKDNGIETDLLCSLNINDVDCKNTTSESEVITFNTLASLMFFYSIGRLIFEGIKMVASIRLVWRMNKKNTCNREEGNEKKDNDRRNEQVSWIGKQFVAFQKLIIVAKQFDYIWMLENWIELPLFILSLIFCISVVTTYKSFCLSAWQWQIGAIILWLSWIEFIFLSTQFKFIGVYTLMFIRIFKSLVKLLPSGIPLVAAFGLTFHLLLYQPSLKASPFFTPKYSILKAFSMIRGEIGADDFFGFDIHGHTRDTSHLQYMTLSTILWFFALFFMAIILSNLMIGLAVGDIQKVYKKAILERIALQVKIILAIESRWMRKHDTSEKKKTIRPNKLSSDIGETVRRELVYLLWGGTHYDSEESLHRLLSAKEDGS